MKTLRSHGFNQHPRFKQVVGYLERNKPLPLAAGQATTFVTSHFYLDDFVQSSEDPNPQPLQHTPLRAIPEDEDLARMRQGGGNRFGEDDLAGDPEADALTNNGQGRAVCAARPTERRQQRTLWAQEQQGSRRRRPSAPSSPRTLLSTSA